MNKCLYCDGSGEAVSEGASTLVAALRSAGVPFRVDGAFVHVRDGRLFVLNQPREADGFYRLSTQTPVHVLQDNYWSSVADIVKNFGGAEGMSAAAQKPRLVIFGSCLTSRSPGDIDFAYDGMAYADAVARVAQWRDANLGRWDVAPTRMHGQEGWIEPDGGVAIPVRQGQRLVAESLTGSVAPRVGTLTPYQLTRSARYAAESRAASDERHYRETRYR